MNQHRKDDEPPPVSGRQRSLRELFTYRASKAHLLAGLLCAVLGFALVTQVRQEQPPLTGLRNTEVLSLLQDATRRSNQLNEQAAELEAELAALRSGADAEAVARRAADERLRVYSVLAGTTRVRGPGLEITIADPRGDMNAVLLLDAIQELRGAGAEALQVGTVRVVASTAFGQDPISGGLLAGGELLSPPYTILAIGDPPSLARALAIPGGVVEQFQAASLQPRILERDELQITALHRVASRDYARPAPSITPTP